MTCGILNINKPAEMTSRRVVDAVQRLVRPAKAGHGGTLDPLATGVLVVCIGSATRLITHVQQGRKVYRAEFLLGRRSNTDDVTGEIELSENPQQPTGEAITTALREYVGEIQQVPPRFSAVHVNGKRAYKLARQGEDVELQPRLVQVYRIDLLSYEFPKLELEIECGSGTYIRSIGRDLGNDLGCGAVMSALVRTRVGPYTLDNATEIANLDSDSLEAALKPPITAVSHLPQYPCKPEELSAISHGRAITPSEFPDSGEQIALICPSGELAAIAIAKGQTLAPKQVFLQ